MTPQDRAALVALLRRARPTHYAGECDHCGIDELPPETCPMLAFIAEIDAALAAAPAGEPVGEPTCQHGTVDWCQQCDDEAREAVRLDVRGEPTPRAGRIVPPDWHGPGEDF